MKLPKEIQKKQKNKPKRPQKVKKRPGGQQFGSRQMRRKMQQQGIDMEPIDATRVIIESPEKNLVIEQPEVIRMEQAGQDIYQVIGTAEEYAPDEIQIGAAKEEEVELEEEELKPTITENDVMLVAAQAGVDKKEAEAALEDTKGDIAKAILFLKNRP
ncbi:MAG: Nascent polypeptide-associated complex protein [Promethearchaeota archaeon]|nr:MAG: Nascent polypeptide-associated complex protein [Candidatus Lokiarchaeota archaeon]